MGTAVTIGVVHEAVFGAMRARYDDETRRTWLPSMIYLLNKDLDSWHTDLEQTTSELGVGKADEMRVDSRSTSTIKLKPDRVYELNDDEMDVTEIVAIVKERCRININHPIIIQPFEGVTLQSLVSILDQINEFADKNVSLAKVDS